MTGRGPPIAAARRRQVGRIGHAFHAARDCDRGASGRDQIVGEHRRLHARPAHLVDGAGAGRKRQPGADRRLASRRLSLASGKDAAEDDFLHRFGG